MFINTINYNYKWDPISRFLSDCFWRQKPGINNFKERDMIINYIKNQKEHHKTEFFFDEFRRLVNRSDQIKSSSKSNFLLRPNDTAKEEREGEFKYKPIGQFYFQNLSIEAV